MGAVQNAKSYDWKTWFMGILRSFLSGGAVALATGGGGALVGIPAKQVWLLMGINFLSMGIYRMGEFLTLHGSPDPIAAVADAEAASANIKKEAAKLDSAVKDIKQTTGE